MSTITNKSILWQAQEVVADILNADEILSGRVSFFPENQKDIDFQLKNALGRQGIVGIVMTPNATYVGTYQGQSLVWDLRDFTVQVVENPVVNRPIANSITALDAAVRVSDCLATPLLSTFGIYCPTTIEQGEDSGLLVAQAKFNTQIRAYVPPPLEPEITYVKYEGSNNWIATDLSGNIDAFSTDPYIEAVEVRIGTGISEIGDDAFNFWYTKLKKVIFADGCPATLYRSSFYRNTTLTAVENFENTACTRIESGAFGGCSALASIQLPTTLTYIGAGAFNKCSSLENLYIPSSVQTLGYMVFSDCSGLKRVSLDGNTHFEEAYENELFAGCTSLEYVEFRGKTTEQVSEMDGYPWGIQDTSVIHGTLG